MKIRRENGCSNSWAGCYGIHANRDEHFGIAPAEMMASGCIVFVHNGGGQVEIMGRDLRLCYQTDKAAVEKILGIVNSATLQAAILDSPPRRTMFSTAAFMGGLRNLADRMTVSGNTLNEREEPRP